MKNIFFLTFVALISVTAKADVLKNCENASGQSIGDIAVTNRIANINNQTYKLEVIDHSLQANKMLVGFETPLIDAMLWVQCDK